MEFKNCPFCGSGDIEYDYEEENIGSRFQENKHAIECMQCGAKISLSNTPYYHGTMSKQEALEELTYRWNQRTCNDYSDTAE